MTDTTYNGWTNHATWNVALWIGGDEGIYTFSKYFDNYLDFVAGMKETNEGTALAFETPDGVSWTDSALDHDELDQIFKEYQEEK
tara:strand:- start:861 stop:1115 length:255 start_codon:yes stop_codon:yes gene_type:complete